MKFKVVIFKADSHQYNDPYCEELKKSGIDAYSIPVISFNFFNLDSLHEKLFTPDNFSALVLTSERCVEALKMAIGSECKEFLSLWSSKLVICTGPATRDRIKEVLGLEAIIGEKHRAEGIVEIVKQEKLGQPVLYPCGELALAKDMLRSSLLQMGVQCECVAVYSTLANPQLSSRLNQILETEDVSSLLMVFFSPSGVKAVLDVFPKSTPLLKTSKFVSIGPTTSEALRHHGLEVWAEAQFPNPDCLCKTILHRLSTESPA